MKITENLILALLKLGAKGEMKNFKTSILIPKGGKEGENITVIITAETLHVHIIKEDK